MTVAVSLLLLDRANVQFSPFSGLDLQTTRGFHIPLQTYKLVLPFKVQIPRNLKQHKIYKCLEERTVSVQTVKTE